MLTTKVELFLEGTDDFKAMSPEKRNCYYPHEKPLEHFDVYSEANCVLQCAWSEALQECGCVPWFLAHHFPDSLMCESGGNRCFKSAVDGRNDADNSTSCIAACLPDCETIQYDVANGLVRSRGDLDYE